jgi:HD superfamily phosphohydrolase YqeK
MGEHKPTRDEAWALLKEFNQSDSLIKHALCVEGVMRYIARKKGENEDKWGVIGLVHDLDYERFPDQHCKKTHEILQWMGALLRCGTKKRHGKGAVRHRRTDRARHCSCTGPAVKERHGPDPQIGEEEMEG